MTSIAAFAAELDRLGAWYPTGDGDALRASGAAWSAAADALDEIAMVLDVAASMVADAHAGEAAERFATLWRKWSGELGYLRRSIAACRQISTVVADVGTDVDVADRAVLALAEQALDANLAPTLDGLDEIWRAWLVDETGGVHQRFATQLGHAEGALPVPVSDEELCPEATPGTRAGLRPIGRLNRTAVDFGFGPGDVATRPTCAPLEVIDPLTPCGDSTVDPFGDVIDVLPPCAPPLAPIGAPLPPYQPGTPGWYGPGVWPLPAAPTFPPYQPTTPYVPEPYVPEPYVPEPYEPDVYEPTPWEPPPLIERTPVEPFEPTTFEPLAFAPTPASSWADVEIDDGAAGWGDASDRIPDIPITAPAAASWVEAPTSRPTAITIDPPGRPAAGAAAAAAGTAGVAAAAGRGRMPFFPFMPMGGMSGGGDESKEPTRRIRRKRDLF